jgi:hypothetical protein
MDLEKVKENYSLKLHKLLHVGIIIHNHQKINGKIIFSLKEEINV